MSLVGQTLAQMYKHLKKRFFLRHLCEMFQDKQKSMGTKKKKKEKNRKENKRSHYKTLVIKILYFIFMFAKTFLKYNI